MRTPLIRRWISCVTPGFAHVRHPAPHFSGTAVYNGEFKELRLDDFKGKYLVLFFYPLDFTFVCPTEIVAFNKRINEFKEINTEVVGVSTDSHYSHLAWTKVSVKEGGVGAVSYPLLSDYNKSISRDYGVLLDKDGFALRGLFIIDANSIIRHMTINDLAVGRSVDEVLRLVQAFQYAEKHGEVCPVNWSKDNPQTIKPDSKASLEYFKQS